MERATSGELLREGAAVEMAHKDLHERGAVQVGQPGDFADDANVAEPLDGVAILAILVADEHHAMDGQLGGMQRSEGQQGVIDGANAAARGQDHGQLKFDHQVQHKLLLVDGHQHAADAFDNHPVVAQTGGQGNAAEIDLGAGPSGGEVGRDGGNKFVDFVNRAIGADSGQAHDGNAIGAFQRAGLNGLPINSVEGGAEQSGESGLAHAGVCAGDEKMVSQPRAPEIARNRATLGRIDLSVWLAREELKLGVGMRVSRVMPRNSLLERPTRCLSVRLAAKATQLHLVRDNDLSCLFSDPPVLFVLGRCRMLPLLGKSVSGRRWTALP